MESLPSAPAAIELCKAIAGWLKCADALPQKVIDTAEHIDSPRVAPFVADTFRYTKRAAITALTSGIQGHPVFEIFATMAPNAPEPVVAAIAFASDREQRRARVHIGGIPETLIEPIRNVVTGEEHRARIELPDGFEFRVAEMGDSVHWKTVAGDHLTMEHEHTYAQLTRIDWSSDGTTR